MKEQKEQIIISEKDSQIFFMPLSIQIFPASR